MLTLFFIFRSVDNAEAARLINISEGAQWHYYKGTAHPPYKWTHLNFDDSAWQKGPSGFGYGYRAINSPLQDMQGNYKRVYVRRKFVIPKKTDAHEILLSVVCNGPFIAYINGIEVVRNSVGFSINGQSPGLRPFELLDISGFRHELLTGTNILSIKCENNDINSANFLFIPYFEIHDK